MMLDVTIRSIGIRAESEESKQTVMWLITRKQLFFFFFCSLFMHLPLRADGEEREGRCYPYILYQ